MGRVERLQFLSWSIYIWHDTTQIHKPWQGRGREQQEDISSIVIVETTCKNEETYSFSKKLKSKRCRYREKKRKERFHSFQTRTSPPVFFLVAKIFEEQALPVLLHVPKETC